LLSLLPILFLTPDPLTALWQDKPQIARRLAHTVSVLYASEEPYLRLLLHALRQGRVRIRVAGLRSPALTHVVDGLYHFHWSPLAPVTGAPLLGPLTAALRRLRLQSALRRLPLTIDHSPFTVHHSPRPILWLFRPGQQHWIDQLHPQLVIYHVVDEYSAYPNLTLAQAARQRELDRQLCTRADLVFCTAQSLVDARLPLNPHTYYLPNAVDYEAFQRGAGSGERGALDELQRPVLGVVGGINAKVDLALMAEVAEQRPDWSIALVGPLGYGLDQGEVARLHALPNIHFTGPVPPEQVPAVIGACDVCLIPYRLTEQTRHVNPLKVYEYLAAGKPVVGTALPELMQFGEMVKMASVKCQVPEGEVSSVTCQVSGEARGVVGGAKAGTDVESFIACVEAALAEAGDTERVAARQAVAAANTWDHRVARMLALIDEALARKQGSER
jgi:glycosyltransferase involved in cell wall biosynthesis